MKKLIENDFILNAIRENFDEEVYLVGGAVRDFLNGKTSYDRDLLVLDADVKSFSERLAVFFDATFIELDAENEIYRLVLRDKLNFIDITKPLNNSVEDDLKHRDLTINSLAVNIRTAELFDPTGGAVDFRHGFLRCFDEKSIIDDPLRLLRFFRFQALYGFEIEPQTLGWIKKYRELFEKPAVERKNYEIIRMFGGKFAHEALLKMDEVGILEQIFPFVHEYKKVPLNTHHHLDLFHHLVETVHQIQLIYEAAPQDVQEHLDAIDFGAQSRLAHLKFAGFLHDLGKFSTWTIDEDGRHRFIKHDDVGAKMAKEFLSHAKFSKKQIAYLTSMIKNHIYPSSVMCAPEVNDKIMMRFVRKMTDDAIDIITLAKADRLSARGEAVSDEMVETNLNNLTRLQEFYLAKKDTLNLEKLLTGEEIMAILNIKAGPQLGVIIKELTEAQINGDVLTKEDAENFVKNL
ncbi:MAG: HD domain-containing protein [Fusobacterium sp.]|nr:HD domain-containing protein [Fusobacterium sp.]